MSLITKTIVQLRDMLLMGETTPTAIAQAYWNSLQNTEPHVHAFITTNEERFMAAAQRVEAQWDKYKGRPLAGIPVAVKDNISTAGLRTTCASKMLEQYVPPFDATVVRLLKQQGSPIIGKTNLDEMAMGSSTEHSYFGPSKNPWALDRVPGGSSGGSAAAVATGQVPYALASDTGGSIRQPASFCGIVGMRPTYGLVSRYGVVAFASSLDQVGPMTRTVSDCALVLEALVGKDPLDATSYGGQTPKFSQELHLNVKGLRIGVPREYFKVEGMEEGVRQRVQEAITVLEAAGAQVKEISLPYTDLVLSCYYIIASAEASANLARFDGVRFGYRTSKAVTPQDLYRLSRGEGLGTEAKRRIMLGTYALKSDHYEAYFVKAQQVRKLITQAFKGAFSDIDVICAPAAPTVAPEIGAKLCRPYALYVSDTVNIPAALAGLPSISVPCGFSDDLPVGLQIIGPRHCDSRVLQVAYAYEQRTALHKLRPLLFGGEAYGL